MLFLGGQGTHNTLPHEALAIQLLNLDVWYLSASSMSISVMPRHTRAHV